MSHRRIITLRDEDNGTDRRHLEAYLDDDGALHIDGHDLGPGTEPFGHDGEYEWFRTIAAAELPRLHALLGGFHGEPILDLLFRKYTGPRSYTLEKLLRDSDIPQQLRVW